MNYTIKTNEQYNSQEIYFDGKPAENVRSALKELKFRWHGVKKCWYGKATAEQITAAIENSITDISVKCYEGYLGAAAFSGCNYDKKWLYGAELSKAIRSTLKEYGVKGCTVSCHSYSGGQHIYVKVKTTDADYIALTDYIDNYTWHDIPEWCEDMNGRQIHKDKILNYTDAEQAAIIKKNLTNSYNRYKDSMQVYSTYSDRIFTAAFNKKLALIFQILDSYNHDDSNSMVDYFDTHFYETVTISCAA